MSDHLNLFEESSFEIGRQHAALVLKKYENDFLSPVLFTLMKSTEPWSDNYYTFNVEAAMQSVGFEHIVASDPRYRTILGVNHEFC
jgi:hypothetical protein